MNQGTSPLIMAQIIKMNVVTHQFGNRSSRTTGFPVSGNQPLAWRKLSTAREHSVSGLAALAVGLAWTLSAMSSFAQPPSAIAISEAFAPGYQYHVNCRVEIKGTLLLSPENGQGTAEKIAVTGKSVIKYDERILEVKDGQAMRTARFYDRMEFERKAGKNDQMGELRKEARRLVILRFKQIEVPFSPDGPLLWSELDMVRTDVFTPALKGLLPAGKVRPGDSWAADLSAVQELTDMETVTKGNLSCTFKSVTADAGGKPFARIDFKGAISGVNEDGPARHELEGYLLFDLTSNHLSYLSMEGTQSLLDKNGEPSGGKVTGTFVLTREAQPQTDQMSDKALKGVKLEPDEENTLLWFISPEVGASFLYPRRWHVAGANSEKRQIGLDEKHGNGLLMTLEPLVNVPAASKFQKEVQESLTKGKVKVVQMDSPKTLFTGIDTFGVKVEMEGKRRHLQYYLVRQRDGGAVLSANLEPTAADFAQLLRDVERIAKGLLVMRPAK
jgi:hypothetical protein